MDKNVEISAKDWQALIDLHEKYERVLLETFNLLLSVSHTSTVPGIAGDAARLFVELEPLTKLVFVADPPFGIQRQN
jgi:hypothetical protein